MYTFNSAAIFFPGHPYIESTTVLSDSQPYVTSSIFLFRFVHGDRDGDPLKITLIITYPRLAESLCRSNSIFLRIKFNQFATSSQNVPTDYLHLGSDPARATLTGLTGSGELSMQIAVCWLDPAISNDQAAATTKNTSRYPRTLNSIEQHKTSLTKKFTTRSK